MSAIRGYLFALVCCAFFVSLVGALPLGERRKGMIRLLCGCVTAIVVLQPLLGLNPAWPEGLLDGLIPERQAESSARNEALLQELVEEQLCRRVQEQAERLGAKLQIEIETKKDEELGSYVPTGICLRGSFDLSQQKALSAYLSSELGLGPESQRWLVE